MTVSKNIKDNKEKGNALDSDDRQNSEKMHVTMMIVKLSVS